MSVASICEPRILARGVPCALALAGSLALAAGPSPAELADAKRAYQAEREACMSGKSHQDRTTCLREAEAAFSEARRGGLSSTTRAPKEAPVSGELTTRGSVEAGGIYREVRIPAQP